jgi:hypothetical protein
MADSRRDNPIEDSEAGFGSGSAGNPGAAGQPGPAAAGPCADCGSPELTLIRDAGIVTFYKCPRCGHLAAPVKRS